MSTLPTELFRAEQVRELDRIAIQERGIAGFELMSRAGRDAFRLLKDHFPQVKSLAVYCGAGNNAGDGYIVAHLALEAGMTVRVYCLAEPEKLPGDALTAYRQYQRSGGQVLAFQQIADCDAELVVDAMLGTGLDRAVTGLYANAISAINRMQKPVLALDIPSGLNADTGAVMGCALRADYTISFIGLKQGLFTGAAADYCGKICFSSLQVPADIYQQMNCSAYKMEQPHLPKRSRIAHKGSNGHVLVIGGADGYSGAVKMAAEAAARTGAGLVSIATRSTHARLLNIARPELMCHGVDNASQLDVLLQKATVIAIGPGLGQSPWAIDLFKAVLSIHKPLVVDADALNLLSKQGMISENWVLTPHSGEAARLLDCSIAEIEKNRFAAVSALQKKYHGVSVLKGAGSLIADSENMYISTTGNPGMASGGFGDVLVGIIAGLLAQGMDHSQATRMAVYLHGEAADLAAQQGERGLLAGDLMPHIRKLVNRE